MSDSGATRHQQRVEELCGASVRALAAEHDLHFRARRLYRGKRLLPISAPHLYPPPDADFASFRGAADGLALRLLHSDALLHRAHAPPDGAARAVFDLLEQQRVESLVAATWPGARHNLRQRFEHWSAAFAASDLFETRSGILLYALAQTARARLSGEPVFEATEDAIETTRGLLAQSAGHHFAALRRTRHDQRLFAPHALALALQVAGMLADLRSAGGADAAEPAQEDAIAAFTLRVEFGDEGDEAAAAVDPGRSRVFDEAQDRYRIFTRAYDEQRNAVDLVRPQELRTLREGLDARIARSGLNAARLARELQALLARPQYDNWDGGEEEGQVDGRRLARLIASPAERRLFRAPREVPQARSLVTLLIDCSGSMKQHIEQVGLLADVLARSLEQAGVGVEVLGYTTTAWNGGRAAKAWLRAGRPPHPGRLNEVRHLVFKDATVSWRRSRLGLAALQKAELYREGVDGEAVDWSCARMRGATDAGQEGEIDRRMLIVVSDGCPMDTATHLANDVHYLDHHLRQVIDRQEAHGDVAIMGLGLGLDLSPYYRHCQALDPTAAISQTTFADVMALIAGHRHR